MTSKPQPPIIVIYETIRDAFYAFLDDDGWAIASHLALSTLMALFPFLIVMTALASLLGTQNIADQAASLMLDIWPEQVAEPIIREMHNVFTQTTGGTITFGALLALYFASNGVEALRVGLNRAYRVTETRNWLILRIESIGYILMAAISLLALTFLIVLGPLIFKITAGFAPWLMSLEHTFTFLRFVLTFAALVIAFLIVHKWLPAGTRTLHDIAPGIIVTLALSLASGIGFGAYLARFAQNYVSTYAGLASVMVALVFLYFISAIVIFGGELNAAIARRRAVSNFINATSRV